MQVAANQAHGMPTCVKMSRGSLGPPRAPLPRDPGRGTEQLWGLAVVGEELREVEESCRWATCTGRWGGQLLEGGSHFEKIFENSSVF